MPKLNYDLLHRLDKHTTKKLYEFIDKEIKIDEIMEKLEIEFPFSIDDSNRIKFNTWLSIDYIDEDGKTFIEKFLDYSSKSLSKLEREVLIDKSKSFVSLFELIEIKDNHMIVHDILQNKEFSIWEKQINNILAQGDFIFARIGKIIDEYTFIEDVSFLPRSVKSMFIEDFIIDFNNKRKEHPDLIIKDYLKKYSLEVIKIYNNCILSAMDLDEDLNSYLYDELDEFEGYLSHKCNSFEIKEHITNLIEFFDYYLSQEDLTLYDLDDLDFKLFFDIAIEDEFISSIEELNSYINTFKNYLSFLNKKDPDFKESYLDIMEVSKIRFSYMEKLNNLSTPFEVDRVLDSKISEALNEDALIFLMDFDKFLLYIINKEVELTEKRKKIKKQFMFDLCLLFSDIDNIDDYQPRQRELTMIDMFYNLSIKLELIAIEDNKIVLSKKGTNFIRLKDGEKFLLIFNCIWNMGFIQDNKTKTNLLDLFNDLEESKSYDVKYIISKYKGLSDEISHINEYFKALGLVKINFCPTYTWEITKLGKIVFIYLYQLKINQQNHKIIDLSNYKYNKENLYKRELNNSTDI
ncbi:hypothetical protein [Tissierella sp. Yu-01]|uniref:hypothetical protein n=1 Tax=Tissierella sp. Yu-01 TaxID=3035694 RepID=UPI00240E87A9|nr:hypothetical protein [Tissierella sp. Yu-01]WFA08705.1 hypothetical protein P3962_13400 [Tissierella sp. Yu-01]